MIAGGKAVKVMADRAATGYLYGKGSPEPRRLDFSSISGSVVSLDIFEELRFSETSDALHLFQEAGAVRVSLCRSRCDTSRGAGSGAALRPEDPRATESCGSHPDIPRAARP